MSTRRAFTLVELLVVIAIIALLVALLLPAINNGRRVTPLKNSCRNNIKQIALALQNHNDTYKSFPALYFTNEAPKKANPALSPKDAADYYSWQTRLLPFVEEDTLYKSVSANSKKFTMPSSSIKVPVAQGSTSAPGSPLNTTLGQFLCPSYPGDVNGGLSNYVALSSTRLPLLLNLTQDKDGNPAYKQVPDGMIIPDKLQRGQSMARMADGTSKTAVVVESVESAHSNWYDPQQGFVVGFYPADSTPIDAAASDYYPTFGPKQTSVTLAQWRFNPTAGNRTALAPIVDNTLQPKIPYHPVKGDPLERTWGPSSAHIGGIIIVGMGDGSVKEIKDDIDPAVFFSAITARGGEAVPPLGD